MKIRRYVYARDLQYAIGSSTAYTGLPWDSIPEDFKHFQKETKELVYILMGTITYSIINKLTKGKLLPGRKIVLLSSALRESPRSDVILCASPKEAFALLQNEDCCICGGKKMYESCIAYATEIVETVVHAVHKNADCYISRSLTDGFVEDRTRSKILREKTESGPLVTAHYYIRRA